MVITTKERESVRDVMRALIATAHRSNPENQIFDYQGRGVTWDEIFEVEGLFLKMSDQQIGEAK